MKYAIIITSYSITNIIKIDITIYYSNINLTDITDIIYYITILLNNL
jgi:hypothetical protein